MSSAQMTADVQEEMDESRPLCTWQDIGSPLPQSKGLVCLERKPSDVHSKIKW